MQPNPLLGTWKYRSFLNDPSDQVRPDDLLFGEGLLTITRADLSMVEGVGTFGEGYEVKLKGFCGYGSPVTLRLQALGTGSKNAAWVYDYNAFLVPAWPHATTQQPALVGSVIRTATYLEDGEEQPAGLVASFYAVHRTSPAERTPHSSSI